MRGNFSEARVRDHNDLEAVSPMEEEDQEDMVGRGIKGQAASYKPSQKEKDEHERSHKGTAADVRRHELACLKGGEPQRG